MSLLSSEVARAPEAEAEVRVPVVPQALGRMSTLRCAAGAKRPLLLEDAALLESLRRIISRYTSDPVQQEDLMQESLVCLWNAERTRPGRTRSWYLQGCRFHIQHCLSSGRSLDSPKRAGRDKRVALDGTDMEPQVSEYHTDGELFELVSFHDTVSVLSNHLGPRERLVLGGLADGLVLREVACKLRLSYPTALKYRRRIAGLTIRLGISSTRHRSWQPSSGRRPGPTAGV
jgi:DNA-directed RNA polymerase specialized sigma24 family protein